MKIFISWSGGKSLAVATKLKDWLPLVLQGSQPWLSTEDIRKGSRWQTEMSDALSNPGAGILCLSRDNLLSPWLMFEAGAISNATVAPAQTVCTYLIDVENAEVGLPLGMFQSTIATRDDTLRLLQSLNSRLSKPLPGEHVLKLFDAFWPELELVISQARAMIVTSPAKRPKDEMLDEILEIVRGLARGAARPDAIGVDLQAILSSLAETPGTATHDLFQRMERAAQEVRKQKAASSLAKINRILKLRAKAHKSGG
jgi:hypothetical protein